MSEKRYFKVFAARHQIGEGNKYIKLFDVLANSQIENDDAIKQRLVKLNVSTDFIAADKNYLYGLLLKCLNDFHHSKTYNLEVKEMLMSVEILFHKGLYHESLKLIARLEKLLEVSENFPLMIELLMWKKKISGYSLGLSEAEEVNRSIDKYIVLLNNLKRITDFYYVSNVLQANNEKYSKRLIAHKFKKIVKEPELINESNALSFSAKIYFYLIHSNYYYMMDNKQSEYDYLQKLILLINSSTSYAVENPLDYVSIYNRFLNIKKFFPGTDFFQDIKELNAFVKKVQINQDVVIQRVFVHTNTHELEFNLINNEYENAIEVIGRVEKEMNKLNIAIETYHLIYFYYLHALTLMYVGAFHKALKYINRVLNDFESKQRPQIYLRTEILNVLIHFDLNNSELAYNAAKLVLKRNENNHVLQAVEIRLLKVLMRICKMKFPDQKKQHEWFESVLEYMHEVKTKSKHSIDDLVGNYEKWVLAKINRTKVDDLRTS